VAFTALAMALSLTLLVEFMLEFLLQQIWKYRHISI
jgi:hypothetical protein